MAWIMEPLRGEVSDKTVTTIGTRPGLEMLGRGRGRRKGRGEKGRGGEERREMGEGEELKN